MKSPYVFSISRQKKAQDDSLQRHLCRRGAHRGPRGTAHFDGLRGGAVVGAGRDTGDDRGLYGAPGRKHHRNMVDFMDVVGWNPI